MDYILNFINMSKKGFSQYSEDNKIKYFNENGLSDYVELLKLPTSEICYKLYVIKNGIPTCKVCGTHLTKLGRGTYPNSACSDKCLRSIRSSNMKGTNNSCHKMTAETKSAAHAKQSITMKKLILENKFTPTTNNYKIFGTLKFNINGKSLNFRSLWEIIYYFLNIDSIEFESIRIPYFDKSEKSNRIYISDFFDRESNTIIEVKPTKYQYTLDNGKIDGVVSAGYNLCIIDETYFDNILPTIDISELILNIKSASLDYDKIKNRILWLNKFTQK